MKRNERRGLEMGKEDLSMDEESLGMVDGGIGNKNDKLKEYPLGIDLNDKKYLSLAYAAPHIPIKSKFDLKKLMDKRKGNTDKDEQNDEEK